MAEKEWYDDIDTTALFWAGLLSILIFVVSVLGAQAIYYVYNSYEVYHKQMKVEPTHSLELLAAQRKDLSEYKRVTVGDKSRIVIPVERAMGIIAKEVIEGKQ